MPRRPAKRASPARPAAAANRIVRGQIWVESSGKPAITDAGADLLDQIDACGSLSEAARRLRYSYRRAWMLLHAMNTRWPSPLATTAIGGKRGGGARLADLGRHVLRVYRDLQIQLEHLLDSGSDPFLPLP